MAPALPQRSQRTRTCKICAFEQVRSVNLSFLSFSRICVAAFRILASAFAKVMRFGASVNTRSHTLRIGTIEHAAAFLHLSRCLGSAAVKPLTVASHVMSAPTWARICASAPFRRLSRPLQCPNLGLSASRGSWRMASRASRIAEMCLQRLCEYARAAHEHFEVAILPLLLKETATS